MHSILYFLYIVYITYVCIYVHIHMVLIANFLQPNMPPNTLDLQVMQ